MIRVSFTYNTQRTLIKLCPLNIIANNIDLHFQTDDAVVNDVL